MWKGRKKAEIFGKSHQKKENIFSEIFNLIISGVSVGIIGIGVNNAMIENWNFIQRTNYLIIVLFVTVIILFIAVLWRNTFIEKKS